MHKNVSIYFDISVGLAFLDVRESAGAPTIHLLTYLFDGCRSPVPATCLSHKSYPDFRTTFLPLYGEVWIQHIPGLQ